MVDRDRVQRLAAEVQDRLAAVRTLIDRLTVDVYALLELYDQLAIAAIAAGDPWPPDLRADLDGRLRLVTHPPQKETP